VLKRWGGWKMPMLLNL